MLGDGTEIGQPFREQHVQDGRQPVGIGARPDREPLARRLRRAAAPGIDHDEGAAALDQPLEASGPVGGGGQAAVRRPRIGAEHQQEVGAVDVGHGHGEAAAEHQRRADLLWALVDGAGGVDVARAERLEERPAEQHGAEVVGVRVAEVDGNGVAAVGVDDGPKAPIDLGPGLLPRHLDQLTVAADQRRTDPVGILVQLLQRRALRADVAVAEHVVAVAADALHVLCTVGTSPQRDLQAAPRLAQGAGPERNARVAHLLIVPPARRPHPGQGRLGR